MSTNIVLSSFPLQSSSSDIQKLVKLNAASVNLEDSEEANADSDFIFEEDSFEDSDWLLESAEFLYVYCLNGLRENHSKQKDYTPNLLFGYKVPRWLWTKQIII